MYSWGAREKGRETEDWVTESMNRVGREDNWLGIDTRHRQGIRRDGFTAFCDAPQWLLIERKIYPVSYAYYSV